MNNNRTMVFKANVLFNVIKIHSICYFMPILTNGHVINDLRNAELFQNADARYVFFQIDMFFHCWKKAIAPNENSSFRTNPEAYMNTDPA